MYRLIFNSGCLSQIKTGFQKIMSSSIETGDRTWGHLASTEHFGRATDVSDYVLLSKDDLKREPYRSSTHASHCMVFARNNVKTFGVYNPRAAVLMQLRFDGYLGFPGGLVDKGEDLVTALNRELKEEMDLDLSKYSIKESDFVVSHFSKTKQLCLNLYAVEVPLSEILEIEKRSLIARDYGSEVLGTVRVPLYTMGDGYRGFPTFLSHAFVGNSKLQLKYALVHCKILTQEDIEFAENAAPVALK